MRNARRINLVRLQHQIIDNSTFSDEEYNSQARHDSDENVSIRDLYELSSHDSDSEW